MVIQQKLFHKQIGHPVLRIPPGLFPVRDLAKVCRVFIFTGDYEGGDSCHQGELPFCLYQKPLFVLKVKIVILDVPKMCSFCLGVGHILSWVSGDDGVRDGTFTTPFAPCMDNR